ncbi:tyrosine-type recombinase/integrase [Paenibacillus albicereus]|uniref:tyrosine-type recombinase/integrase n=1 Tax=Paenibacillus albicereus TaxID=2726185 RepID=UPI001F43B143|nr:tyrosine-type recombinase/integrase [Paenibacillus albicereus]
MLFYTGLRIGEALGLNWNDIDLEVNQLRVNKTLDITTRETTTTKTAGSVGYNPFPTFISKALAAIKKNPQKSSTDSTKVTMFSEVPIPTIIRILAKSTNWYFPSSEYTI